MKASGYTNVVLLDEPLNLSEGYDESFWAYIDTRVDTAKYGMAPEPIPSDLSPQDSIHDLDRFRYILECEHRPSSTDPTILRVATIYAWLFLMCPDCAPLHNPPTYRGCDGCGEAEEFLAAFQITPETVLVDGICGDCLTGLGFQSQASPTQPRRVLA